MRQSFAAFIILSAFLPALPALAQTSEFPDIAPPPAQGEEIPLKAGSPAEATEPESWFKLQGNDTVHNVAQPTLTPFLPDPDKATGAAVVIAPGGGFMLLSIKSEGWDVARWLADHGVAAFVVKYRLLPSPATGEGTIKEGAERLSRPTPFKTSDWFLDGTRMAAEDGAEALRVVRENAEKWHVDPKKVGFMGFSAGAFTTLAVVNASTPETMPAFVAPIYGSMDTPLKPLPENLPPMWFDFAADDPLVGKTDFGLLPAWREKGAMVELHVHENGGHGYGFAGTEGTTTVYWPQMFLDWLTVHGFAR